MAWMTQTIRTMVATKPLLSSRPTANQPHLAPAKKTTTAPISIIVRQCAGTRKDGKQCMRKIPLQSSTDSSLVYCHDHRPDLYNDQPSSLSVNDQPTQECRQDALIAQAKPQITKLYDCWSLWINKNLSPRKRRQLQLEIMKPVSTKDEPGYLYAYHLMHGPRVSTDHYCYFKIGRSTNPARRMHQVSNRCGYHPRLLDVMPSQRYSAQSKSKRKAERWTKCPLSHRVERLIHLELSSLYPSAGGFKCKSCGTTHREWFRVKRPTIHQDGNEPGRLMTDQEVWLEKIRPIMLHWIRYSVAVSATLAATPP
ncbi:DUF1766-domain-containing protein [Hesseltinella vesiculosa]|uniref:DUF1766-domain-containing protein n=1 Tax=Hesseltinella vesiculosa TaxID=101127 RepID=A0A1X2GUW5_9FUNG|nr:DUF1766-domain-containing protein [Hesseltinella vesiculosa]